MDYDFVLSTQKLEHNLHNLQALQLMQIHSLPLKPETQCNTTLSYWQFVYAFLDCTHSLQTFAIPGSIFLSILSGFLFPFPLALFLVCTVS